MLADYIVHRIQTLQEKAYNKLVLILATSSLGSVLISGVSLIFNSPTKYLAYVVLLVGALAAKAVLKKTERKIRLLLAKPEKEIYAKKYLAALKDEYDEEELLRRLATEPKVEDPLAKREKKPLEAARFFIRGRYAALKARVRVVLLSTAIAAALPHLIVVKDVGVVMVMLLIVWLLKN